MELKSYQKKVIADLTRYLELLNETKSDAAAFRLFWQEKSAPARRRQDLYCLQRRSPYL